MLLAVGLTLTAACGSAAMASGPDDRPAAPATAAQRVTVTARD